MPLVLSYYKNLPWQRLYHLVMTGKGFNCGKNGLKLLAIFLVDTFKIKTQWLRAL